MLREKERDLTGVILTHAFWSEVPGPERLDARPQLNHALEREDGEGQEAGPGPERLDARPQLNHALEREDGEGQEAA
ncbi:hypothetical protein [Streptomyces sp. ME01-18h]|uniref:hypothetical protein n=1 Tax=Streptomyces sp. ME01-18h TaxID=462920 RepID=UPI0029A87500|nr:hypothetical protein [Streptomyces sp. ME01-18h]MDX3403418.1 hypothetical protein [Streptomyces sp. ME01-18h]